MSWELAYVLPNAHLIKAIEVDSVALVPPSDARLNNLLQKPAVKALLTGFTDQYKVCG